MGGVRRRFFSCQRQEAVAAHRFSCLVVVAEAAKGACYFPTAPVGAAVPVAHFSSHSVVVLATVPSSKEGGVLEAVSLTRACFTPTTMAAAADRSSEGISLA